MIVAEFHHLIRHGEKKSFLHGKQHSGLSLYLSLLYYKINISASKYFTRDNIHDKLNVENNRFCRNRKPIML